MLCADNICGSVQFLEHHFSSGSGGGGGSSGGGGSGGGICYYCYTPQPSSYSPPAYSYTPYYPPVFAPYAPGYRPGPNVFQAPTAHMTPPKPPSTNDPWNMFSPSCAGRGCTAANVGSTVGSVGAAAYPVARNLAKLNVLSHLWSGAFYDAPITRAMTDEGYDRFITSIPKQGWNVAKASPYVDAASKGLSVLGGGIQAYGEWNSTHSVGKTVAVGVADTGVNLGASVAGEAVGTAAVGVAASVLGGTEWGATIGTALGGPVGTSRRCRRGARRRRDRLRRG